MYKDYSGKGASYKIWPYVGLDNLYYIAKTSSPFEWWASD